MSCTVLLHRMKNGRNIPAGLAAGFELEPNNEGWLDACPNNGAGKGLDAAVWLAPKPAAAG